MSRIDELLAQLAQIQRLEEEGKDLSALTVTVNEQLEAEFDRLRPTKKEEKKKARRR